MLQSAEPPSRPIDCTVASPPATTRQLVTQHRQRAKAAPNHRRLVVGGPIYSAGGCRSTHHFAGRSLPASVSSASADFADACRCLLLVEARHRRSLLPSYAGGRFASPTVLRRCCSLQPSQRGEPASVEAFQRRSIASSVRRHTQWD